MSKKSNSVKNSSPAVHLWGNGNALPISSKAASLANPLKMLLQEYLESLISAVNASSGMIRLLTPEGQMLQTITSAGLPAELLVAERDEHPNCETCSSASYIRGIYSADLRTCKTRQECCYAKCHIESLISATIESHTTPNNPIGVLTLYFNEAQESFERTSKTVLAFARLLGAIIDKNKSSRDAQRAELLAERQAIANEIHDSLAQTLVYTRMRNSLLLESIRTGNELMAAKYAHEVDEALEISQKTVRELITDFRCSMDPSGLLHALQTLAEQFRDRNDIALEYLNQASHLDLPLEYEIQVHHIVQEALTNIASHSEATHARLSVETSGNHYVFTIEDNGSGGCTFTPVEGHYGMMIMRERAQRIGGEIKVESSQGVGTRVQLSFPEPGSNWREVNE